MRALSLSAPVTTLIQEDSPTTKRYYIPSYTANNAPDYIQQNNASFLMPAYPRLLGIHCAVTKARGVSRTLTCAAMVYPLIANGLAIGLFTLRQRPQQPTLTKPAH